MHDGFWQHCAQPCGSRRRAARIAANAVFCPMTRNAQADRTPVNRWLPWIGGLLGLAGLSWVLRGFDFSRFGTVIGGADLRLVALVPASILLEQLVRAWKWRQLLYRLRPVAVMSLFGAIMAGYLLAILIPLGFGTIARSWLVARREQLRLASVLATVAMDRLTDGIVFACLVPIALFSVVFDDPTGDIHAGLVWGGAGSALLIGSLIPALFVFRRAALDPASRVARYAARLPPRFAAPVQRLMTAFAHGVAWPRSVARGVAIVLASVIVKLLAATTLLWAGWAIGVELAPAQYLFVMVFLGFLIILGHFLRFVGSFVVGGVYALGLFGVPSEQALVMVLLVEASNLLSVGVVGAIALWAGGVSLADAQRVQQTGPG